MTTKSRCLSGNDKSCKEIKLPVGYRFDPTDVELLEHYLIPKLKGEELPSQYVMDFDVYQYEPHQLPLNKFEHAKEKQAHFFTEDTRWKNSEDSVRITPNGCWKICDEDIPIYRNNEEIIIGFKTKLYFHDSNGNKTDWKMIEYRCHPNHNIKSFIICKVKQKMKIEEELSEEELLERENANNLANHM